MPVVKSVKSQSELQEDKVRNRGTTDELEILRIVLEENQQLKKMVLNALRSHMKQSKESLLDSVKDKKKADKKEVSE